MSGVCHFPPEAICGWQPGGRRPPAASEGVLATWKPRFNMDRFVLPRLGNIVAVACDEERFQYLAQGCVFFGSLGQGGGGVNPFK